MILTVTLNPAVDKTYTTGELITGHVNRMRTVMKIAGGKGINVTKILNQYGFPVCATGFLGGYSGQFIEDYLKEKQVMCRFIAVEEETRNNMNILADNGYVTEILEPGPVIDEAGQQKFLAQYEELLSSCELVVLSGSIGNGMQENIYKTLIETAACKGIRVLLDTSGESLRKGIGGKPYLIKPNQKELEYIIGHKLVNKEAVISAARALQAAGINRVIVSMGKSGLLSVSGEHIYFAKTKRIHAVNTVGCGDSVVASYAMSILRGDSEEEALRRAAALSAANATTIESANIPMETAEELYDTVTIEELA
ncbi:MAG: 1-phosphofructokinase [Lachnospiraceae bacterium]|nr:1-phosphofructokinase [Lachnospiraceae bacterium]